MLWTNPSVLIRKIGASIILKSLAATLYHLHYIGWGLSFPYWNSTHKDENKDTILNKLARKASQLASLFTSKIAFSKRGSIVTKN